MARESGLYSHIYWYHLSLSLKILSNEKNILYSTCKTLGCIKEKANLTVHGIYKCEFEIVGCTGTFEIPEN